MSRRELPPPPSAGPSGYLIAAVLMALVCPSALLAWGWAAWARSRCARWVLPTATAVMLPLAVVVGRGLAPVYVDLGRDFLAAGGQFGGMAGVLARSVILTWPVGFPVGLAAAMVTGHGRGNKRPESGRLPAPPRRIERENVQRSPYLAKVLPSRPEGDLGGEWRHRGYLVIPEREANLSQLILGRPGRGKTVYLLRRAYLAGRLAMRTTVVDCKGEPGFAAQVLAAYAEGWRDGRHPGHPTVHLWPAEPLNGWTGGPVAVANRLLSCWAWNPRNEWYREPVAMALRLALQAPGDPVSSSSDLVYRMQPGVLKRLWEEHPDEAALVASLDRKQHLDDVSLRVGNLMASLGATLDGARPLGTADCTVLSLPVAAAEHDAAAILRVAMADLAHHVTVRKDPTTREQIIIDEFSAVPGGRDHAIHLAERGRSARVAVVLAVQSDRGLGDDHDADRLVGAAGSFVLFAVAEPERIIRLAGTRRLAEDTSTSWGERGATVTTSMVWKDQVDANIVRALAPGQAYVLSGGRAQLCQVIRPPGSDQPCATAPAGAADEREVPPPVQSRQGQARSARGFASLDPPGRSSVTRKRPPAPGGGSPPDDRDNQEAP